MKKAVKFASQIDAETLRELKKYAAETDRSISGVLSEAVEEYLQRVRVRPAFKRAVNEVISENTELLKRLAK